MFGLLFIEKIEFKEVFFPGKTFYFGPFPLRNYENVTLFLVIHYTEILRYQLKIK